MANWKELVFTDSVENLGNSDLTVSSSTRSLVLSSPITPPSLKTFAIQQLNETNDASEQLFTLAMGAPQSDGSFSNSLLNMNAQIQTWVGSTLEATYSSQARINTPSFEIRNTAAGSAAKPFIKLTRLPNDGPGEDSDNIGSLEFNGEDSQGITTKYASFDASIVDATNFSEDGAMDIRIMNAGSDASALKILPDPAEPLKALKVYDEFLWTLVQNATKYNCRKHLKMVACHTNNYGLPVNEAMLFRFNPPQASSAPNNDAYELNSTLTANFIGGSYNIDGAQGDFLFDQDADEDDGLGDGWFSHERSANSPSVQVRVHGSVWYKPKVDPTDGQKIRFFYGYNQQAGGTVTDISESSGMEFAFGGYASDDITLSDGEEITKMEFEFTKTLPAIDVKKTELFIVGIKNTSSTTTSIGQNASNSVINNTGGFVADLEMEVLAVSA